MAEVKNVAQKQSSEARQRMSAATPTGLPPLTAKQETFVGEYLKDLNAAQAAIRAGYSKKTAKEIGCQNLAKPNIAATIAKKMEERAVRVGIEADDVLRHLKVVALSNITEFVKFGPGFVTLKYSDEIPSEQSACIAEVSEHSTKSGSSVKFRLHDKIRALDLAARHLGLYRPEKQQFSFAKEVDTAIHDAIQDIINGK